jgi:hypothetical protein
MSKQLEEEGRGSYKDTRSPPTSPRQQNIPLHHTSQTPINQSKWDGSTVTATRLRPTTKYVSSLNPSPILLHFTLEILIPIFPIFPITTPITTTTTNNPQYQNTPDEHKAKISHELIGGAAAYEAAKAYENHCEQNGKPESHKEAKELLAGFAGAFIDREFETRGVCTLPNNTSLLNVKIFTSCTLGTNKLTIPKQLDFVDRERAKHNAHERLNEQVQQDY